MGYAVLMVNMAQMVAADKMGYVVKTVYVGQMVHVE
jgi:hypothetical protein